MVHLSKKGAKSNRGIVFKCPVLCGPYMYNFSEIIDEMKKNNAGIMVLDQKELEEKFCI